MQTFISPLYHQLKASRGRPLPPARGDVIFLDKPMRLRQVIDTIQRLLF